MGTISQNEAPRRCDKPVGRGFCKSHAVVVLDGVAYCNKHIPLVSAVAPEEQAVSVEPAPEVVEVKKLPKCQCGCGKEVLKNNRSYLQGHDQRHRGILLRLSDRGDEESSELLVRKGWYSGLELITRQVEYADKQAAKQRREARAAENRIVENPV